MRRKARGSRIWVLFIRLPWLTKTNNPQRRSCKSQPVRYNQIQIVDLIVVLSGSLVGDLCKTSPGTLALAGVFSFGGAAFSVLVPTNLFLRSNHPGRVLGRSCHYSGQIP